MDVEEYRKTRYKGIDQKIISRRERNIVGKILKRLNEKCISILDVPCGYGRFSELFLKRSLSLTSIDISLPMVLTNREHSPRTSSGHHFLVGDIRHLPLKDGSFDCIVTIRLFQHIHEPSIRIQILKEIYRVARRIVVVSFYRYNLLHSAERWVRCWIRNEGKKISMLPLNDFRKEVNSAGFKVLNLFPVIRCFHAQNIFLLRKFDA